MFVVVVFLLSFLIISCPQTNMTFATICDRHDRLRSHTHRVTRTRGRNVRDVQTGMLAMHRCRWDRQSKRRNINQMILMNSKTRLYRVNVHKCLLRVYRFIRCKFSGFLTVKCADCFHYHPTCLGENHSSSDGRDDF